MYFVLWVLFIFPGEIPFSLASVGEPDVKWSHPSVSVCWGAPEEASKISFSEFIQSYLDFSKLLMLQKERLEKLLPFREEDRVSIQDEVTSEFTLARTGIEFVGWKSCSELSDADVILLGGYERDFSWAWATIGENGFKDQKTEKYSKILTNKKPYLFIRQNSSEEVDLLIQNALHEFGHISGLRHEHSRKKEKENDLNCTCFPPTSDDDESLGNSARKYSVYDSDSVMNYCRMRMIERLGLTYLTQAKNAYEEFALDRNRIETLAPVLKDPTLYSVAPLVTGEKKYKLRLGLSQGDLNALSCMYKSDEEYPQLNCRDDYNPLSAGNVQH